MDLSTFITVATPAERKALADFADTTVAYLRKISTTASASKLTAYLVEQGTAQLSKKNDRLEKVPGQTLVRSPDRYLAFVRKLPKQAKPIAVKEARP